MYPFLRLAKEFRKFRTAPALPLDGIHVSQHRCWPQDIDIFLEMNNGRVLTLLDLGRVVLARRVGLLKALKTNRWGMTMAGVSVRYRRRITTFQAFEMRSRALGWDDRFIYLDQSMWRGETCCYQALYRSAITGRDGIVPPAEVARAVGHDGPSPELPAWVTNWIDAEATRPWPPTQEPELLRAA